MKGTAKVAETARFAPMCHRRLSSQVLGFIKVERARRENPNAPVQFFNPSTFFTPKPHCFTTFTTPVAAAPRNCTR